MNKKNARFTMPSAILMGGMAILAGCMNGVYTIDSSIDCDDEIESMPYELVNDKADPFKEVLFKEDTMPVVVNEVSHGDTVDSSNLTVFLWGLTLGVFPAFESHTETYDLSVLTPIGKKSKSYSTTKRSWMGWIPIVVPVPGWGVSRWYFTPESKEAEEQRDRNLRLVREKTIKAIVGEFSSSEYQHFAKNTNDVRAKELDRIKNVKAKIDGHVAKNEFDEAEELRANESEEKPGTWACDKDTWNSIKQEIVNKKEDYRVANKKTELEKLFGESKFEDVVAECEKESGGEERHASVWSELKAKAKKAISDRDRKIELARIEKRKAGIAKLLEEKRYVDVIDECEKETGANVGARPEDAEIWAGFRTQAVVEKDKIDRAAEEERIAAKVAHVNQLLAEKKYVEVVSLCEEEHGQNPGSRAEDVVQWEHFKSQANQKIQEDEFSKLLTRVNENDVEAFVALGDLYASGNLVVPRDKDKAIAYYEKACNGGKRGLEARILNVMTPTEQLSYFVKSKKFKEISRIQGRPWSYDQRGLEIGWNCLNWHDNALCRRGESPVMFQAQKYYSGWMREGGDPRWIVSSVDDDGVWLTDNDDYNRRIFVYTSDTYVDADELKEGWYLYVGVLKTFSSTVHSYVRVPEPSR